MMIMKKRKIVIATHGTLAAGFASALELIVGKQEITAVCCYTDPDFNMERTIDEILKNLGKDEELYVFTDLFGGSVNNAFMKALCTSEFHLITNSSLGMLMDFILSEPTASVFAQKLKAGEFNAVYCNTLMGETASDIEEDL